MSEWGFYFTSKRNVLYWLWVVRQSPLIPKGFCLDLKRLVVLHLRHCIRFTQQNYMKYCKTSHLNWGPLRQIRLQITQWMKQKGHCHSLAFESFAPFEVLIYDIARDLPAACNILILVQTKGEVKGLLRHEWFRKNAVLSICLLSTLKKIKSFHYDFVFLWRIGLTLDEAQHFAHCHILNVDAYGFQ